MRAYFPISLLISVLFLTCIDPVVPAIRNDTDILLIEGDMMDQPGRSWVTIARWVPDGRRYIVRPQDGMQVVSIAEDGAETSWNEQQTVGRYAPPVDFTANIGSTYFLRVTTPDGTIVESRPETVPTPVPAGELSFEFEAESYFRPAIARFVPAFKYYLTIDDPAGQSNYYRVAYRKWETVNICASCEFGRYRDGACIPDNRNRGTWEYNCDTICYQITEGDENAIISDEFSDGGMISQLEVARIDHTRQTGGLLFEARLASLSKPRFEYLKQIQDLSENGSSLNATIPAPLVGNLQLVNIGEESNDLTVLGFVGTAAETTSRLFFNREDIEGQPLPDQSRNREEPGVVNCDQVPLGCPPAAPCDGPGRTSIQPEGWGQ